MTLQQIAVPGAVLVAGLAVAGAVVLTRAPVVEAPAPVVAAPAVAVPAPEVAPPAVVPTGPTPEVQARGFDNARRALEAMRPEFLAKCWAPSVAARAEPAQIQLTFNVSFSPEGVMNGLGISEDHAAYRADVGECLRKLDIPLKIPAPGVMLYFAVPFTLP